MKRTIVYLLLLLLAMPIWAEDSIQVQSADGISSEGRYGVVHTDVLKIRAGYARQLDTYLSPMAYHGMHIGISNEWWQPFRPDTRLGQTGRLDHWAHVGRLDLNGALYISPARSNSVQSVILATGWGAFHCWKWYDDRLKIHLGPYLEANLGIRTIAGNVNKPVSFDIGIDLMAMGGASWSWYGRKTSYRLNYLVRTNIVGFDFMPEYWQSYYEIATGVPGNARCSGHWNHHVLKHELTIDMQFCHSTWRIGAEHEWNDYGTSNLHFDRNQISIVIGCIWNYRLNPNARL